MGEEFWHLPEELASRDAGILTWGEYLNEVLFFFSSSLSIMLSGVSWLQKLFDEFLLLQDLREMVGKQLNEHLARLCSLGKCTIREGRTIELHFRRSKLRFSA